MLLSTSKTYKKLVEMTFRYNVEWLLILVNPRTDFEHLNNMNYWITLFNTVLSVFSLTLIKKNCNIIQKMATLS